MGNAGKITRNTTIKVRLYPTPEQAALIDRTFGCCRWLWNAILADEQEFFAATGEHYLPTPARYKKDAPFLKEADSQALVTVHQNLRRAFQDFFNGKSGYPQFKRGYSRDAYTVYCHHYYGRCPDSIRIEGDGVMLPKVRWVRAKLHRRPLHWWTLCSATVSKTRDGKYDCSLLYRYDAKEPEPVEPERVGTYGEAEQPEHIVKAERRLAGMEEKLRRMQPGSKNYELQQQRIAREREHIANQKRDQIHKETHRLATEYDAVRLEGGGAALREKLRYKLERQGKALIEG